MRLSFGSCSVMASNPAPTRMALVNARSLANKSFILNYFFTSNNLDILYVTETWLGVGESSVFSEVLPLNCSYLNSPQVTGKGWRNCNIFKDHLSCRRLSAYYSSFELSVFQLNLFYSVLCAVVYRPPKYNKDFINDFSDFLAGIMPKYD